MRSPLEKVLLLLKKRTSTSHLPVLRIGSPEFLVLLISEREIHLLYRRKTPKSGVFDPILHLTPLFWRRFVIEERP